MVAPAVLTLAIRRLSQDIVISNRLGPNNEKPNTGYSYSKELEANATPELQQDEKEKKKSWWKKYIGLILTLLASICFSLGVLFAKLLSEYGYRGNSSSFWRYVGITGPALPMLFYFVHSSNPIAENKDPESPTFSSQVSTCSSTVSIVSAKTEPTAASNCKPRESPFSTIWPLTKGDNWKTAIGVLLRGFFGAMSVILRYYALNYLPIGDTAVITYSTPVIVTVLAHFLLGEKAGLVSCLVAFITLIGVVIVAKPPVLTGAESFTTQTLIGTAFAVASLLTASCQIMITRKLREVHFMIMTVVTGITGLGISIILMVYFQDFVYPTTPDDAFYVVGIALTSFLGQMAIILALQFEQAGPVTLVRTVDVLFGFLFQFLFLAVIPEWTSVVGGILVVGGVLVTGARKWAQTLPADDDRKRRFKWLLI